MTLILYYHQHFFSLEEDWYLGDKNPWKWLYDYGTIPGILVSIISFSLLVIYKKNTKLSLLRPYLLICGFTPIIASLIFVNIVLKDHTGRPRPREISKFNGNWNYKPVFKLGIPGKGHSFPCGHCSIAFTLTSGIVFFRRNPKFALLSFSAGLVYGILMSIARIVQGGHFLSDTIWSLGIVFSTIIVLYYFIFQPPINEKKNALFLTKGQKLKIVSFNTIALILLIVFVFTRRPFFKDHVRKFEINNDIKLLELHVPNNWNLSPNFIDKINSGAYLLEVKGYAPPYTTHYLSFVPKINGNIMKLEFNENI
jgi:PAP2 (acid phosphatase) superfamily protein